MFKKALLSITFRQHDAATIADAARAANLDGIEWGGDVHVPHGDLAKAEAVAEICRSRGLCTCGYGSYYRAGVSGFDFAGVLKSAETLGAPVIRVWAGDQGSLETSGEKRQTIVKDLLRIADLAAAKQIRIGLEFHGNTLTDTLSSCKKLMFEEANHPNLYSYWQPPVGSKFEDNLAAIKDLGDKITACHVFSWELEDGSIVRYPLAHHRREFIAYLRAVNPQNFLYAGLEFVKNDDLAEFRNDAATFGSLIHEI